jgi:hypothetical protein
LILRDRKYLATLAVCGAVVLYVFLACYRLSKQDVLPDEASTLYAAQQTTLNVVLNRLTAGHLPLYFLLVHAMLECGAPQTLPVLEIPSIVLGLAGVVLFYLLAKQLGLGKWSLVAPYVYALHPIILYHNRLARPNAGALMLQSAILVVMQSFSGRRAPPGAVAVLLILAIVSALWLHILIALWVLIVLSFAIPAVRKTYDPRLLWISLAATAMHGCTLTLCSTLSPMAIAWLPKTTPEGAWSVLTQTLGGEGFWWGHLGGQWLLALLLGITWLGANFSVFAARVRQPAWMLIYALAVLPPLAMILISTVKPVMHERYLAQFVAPLLLVLLHIASRLPWQKSALAAMCTLVLVIARESRDHWRSHSTGIRPAIERMEELTAGRNDLGVCYIPTFRQMMVLCAKRPHKTLVLNGYQSNAVAQCTVEAHLKDGGLLWELAPSYWSAKLWDEMGDVLGEATFTKSWPLFTLRTYERKAD